MVRHRTLFLGHVQEMGRYIEGRLRRMPFESDATIRVKGLAADGLDILGSCL